MKWLDSNQIQIDPPKKPKKITGTRFATILGLNPWATPFEIWCAVTKTYEKPFEDTIYTSAGKTIEPKQAQYMKKSYFMENLITPTDVYGEDYFKKTWGDFFPQEEVVGGMWDYLLYDENNKPTSVLEMKTTKRAEDWKNGIPEYYALQGALYAYLLKVDDVIMVASFLDEKDYSNPDDFAPNASNTIVIPFKISEKYPNFEQLVKQVEDWWNEHVLTGVSPIYDEKKDESILKELKTNTLSPDSDINELLKEADYIKDTLNRLYEPIEPLEYRLKVVSEIIKEHALKQFRDGDNKVVLKGDKYEWTLSMNESSEIDKKALASDGILDKYTRSKTTYRLSNKSIKD